MNKLFVVCLMMIAGSAWAEWLPLFTTDSSMVVVHFPSVHKDGDSRKVWTITNLKVKNEKGLLSWRVREEYDCKNKRSRILSFSTHTETMANGRTVSVSDQVEPWSEIPPETAIDSVMRYVCNQ